jgi:hypothetical protein
MLCNPLRNDWFQSKNPEIGLATSARDEIPSQGPRSLYTYPTWTMMAGLSVARYSSSSGLEVGDGVAWLLTV